jgi:pSer/pThr/pTyr-binding forkhead associated (FHA) protein
VKDAEAGFGAASEQGTLVFGTPVTPRYARLSQRTTEGVSCDVFHVRKPETVLGRESGDVVFPDDPFMSRRHASLRFDATGAKAFRLTDLGSSNGSFVRIRGEIALKHGDEFRVGQQLLRVVLNGAS